MSNPLLKTQGIFCLLISLFFSYQQLHAQSCATAQGDQSTYGTNNVWIGYVYTGMNFNKYQGYVTEGSSSSSNFNEGFGGGGVTYNTNGCSITTDSFSVRYKLAATLSSGTYVITVGGDDGYRFSIDGGTSFIINNWVDHSYTATSDTLILNGSYNFVLEYYQKGGNNQVSFNIVQLCVASGSTTTYGTNNVWNGYLYQGTNFQTYKGTVTEGSTASPNFNENFGNPGGSSTNTYATNQCSITTSHFSAAYLLTQNLPAGSYTFTVGGDDGYRFSLNGGSTWVINNWVDHVYATTTYSVTLPAGSYNTVLQYYQDAGYDRVSYSGTMTVLPITISSWSGILEAADKALLKWTATDAINFSHFTVQRSTDAVNFQDIATIDAVSADSNASQQYSYTDVFDFTGNVFYRLKMVDQNALTNYSSILSLPMQSAASIRIYPTVTENNSFFVESSATLNQARVEVFNMLGQKIVTKEWDRLQGRQEINLAGNGYPLAAGLYLVRLSNNQAILAKQLIILK